MDVHRQSLTATARNACAGLDTPSELAARLTVARTTLAPQVPCALWQAAYVRIGRYLDALNVDPAVHEALIRSVLADAAAANPDDERFIAAALAALYRRLESGEAEPLPAVAVPPTPPMPAIARSHMRPLALRRRQLRDVWDRHLGPAAAVVLRVVESCYRTLRLIAS